MMATTAKGALAKAIGRAGGGPDRGSGRPESPLTAATATNLLVQRNYIAYRSAWWIFVSGFLEPVFYLFSIGVGVGALVTGFTFNGGTIPYAEFVAPGMLAASAMNGALLDSTYNFFFKLKYNKLFDQMLATPLTTSDIARGELAWSLLRGGIYSAVFLLVMVAMGLVHSWWAVLAVPAALLIGAAFGGLCMALTTYMRSWQDFDFVTLGQLPLFLFSATFFPLTAFPDWIATIVACTPLYRAVVLVRELTTGSVTWASGVSVVYLIAMMLIGLAVVGRRLDRLLLS
jgi:lipooligosaccharide transport system permease protein